MINNDIKKILVLDFGGQYAHLISRRFRNLGYYSEITNPDIDVNEIKNAAGIVLSGGPSSVYDPKAPKFNNKILSLNIPILGLCYGHQLIIQEYGGEVGKNMIGEYGYTIFNNTKDSPLFKKIKFPLQVWMSHSDSVVKLPIDFELIGSTKDCRYAASQNLKLERFTLQFHPEVKDTICGNIFLNNFAKFCKMKKNWNTLKVLDNIKARIIEEAKDKKILVFLSGGIDSSVSFALLIKILGKKRVLGLFINNGFMRKNETESVKSRYNRMGYNNVLYEDYEETFLKNIKKVIDPQEKRKIVGETFLEVRNETVKKLNLIEEEWLLAQGTLYPDIIESGGTKHADVIKTHHNRVLGIKQLLEKGLVIEPLKELYKDEVRILGKKIGLSKELIHRHPFPGPGISINLLCSSGKIDNLEHYSKLYEKIVKLDLMALLHEIKYEIALLPVKSVGVQGDVRTYNYPASLKIINLFENFIGWKNLEIVSSFITNNLKEINRVVLEIFKKNECTLRETYCTKDRLDMIREVDAIVIDALKTNCKYNDIFQHLTISLPFASNEDSCSIVLRPVVSEDVMTARFAHFDMKLFFQITEKINKLNYVDALYYDITNKPPATFGWE